ncbi:MAG: Ig-like domain-containing protein [Arhodomonas sp.]|nr:Ig-like domain-containing protein [Arhodomonas sp.]
MEFASGFGCHPIAEQFHHRIPAGQAVAILAPGDDPEPARDYRNGQCPGSQQCHSRSRLARPGSRWTFRRARRPTLAASADSSVTLTAVAKDSDNRVVEGVEVDFRSDSGELVVQQAVTDASGQAIATLSPGSNVRPRTIVVTVTALGASASTQIEVTEARNSLVLRASARLPSAPRWIAGSP